ncbi:MAG: hypothetical protein ABIV48_13850 [Pyrinomonadaceae bacterium]
MDKMTGKPMDMAMMMKSPHHMLMMAHQKSMAEFAKALHDQAMMPKALDIEFARAAVAELRHNLDAMDAIHQKHMSTMSDEMKAMMKSNMDKMEMGHATTKDNVVQLETAVRSNQPDAKHVAMHADALLKHFQMMSKMHGTKTPGKKMTMKKTTTMKPM